MFKEILHGIYCLYSDSLLAQGSTFCRFSEHYESVKYHGKIFTHSEYRKYYCDTLGNGKYNYNTTFIGFNVPDIVFKPFLKGDFDPLTKNEKALLELVRNIQKPFYVIGVCNKHYNHESSLKHEIAHGLWYLHKDYREFMQSQIRKMPKAYVKEHNDYLLTHGYRSEVLEDELQANMVHVIDPFLYEDPTGTLIATVKEMRNYYKRLCEQELISS